MATEDSNQGDELLKRYAKERREQGGGFELHPATRRLLQAEVARQFRAREPEKRGVLSWLGWWRGRLVLGGAVAAVIVLAVWMSGPGSKPQATMQLAKNDGLADESRMAERENLRLGEANKPGAAGQPPTPARGLFSDADRKPVEELARLKESPVAAITASGSLSPVQDSPVDARAKYFAEDYAIVPKTKTENYFAFTPPAPLRYANAPTSTFAVGAMTNPSTVATFSLQPQLAYDPDAGAVRPQGGLQESVLPREAAQALPAPRDVALRSASASPAVPPQGIGAAAASAPAQTLALDSQTDAFGVERKMSVASADQKIRSRASGDLTALPGGAPAAGTRGEVLTFHRQGNEGRQENPARNFSRIDLIRLQAETAVDKSAAASEVLSQFTVELNGDTIRVTDADQSIYEGAISEAEVVAGLDSDPNGAKDNAVLRSAKRSLLKVEAPVSGTGQDYSFRAVGSNVTLKQVVIVNGRLSGANGLAGTVSRPAVAGGAAPAPAAAPAPTRNRFSSDAAGARGAVIATNAALTIEGTVRVGATNEQRFRAVRSTR